MKLKELDTEHNPFFYTCVACHKQKASDDKPAGFADLDGEPFKTYYCNPCAVEAFYQEVNDIATGQNNG